MSRQDRHNLGAEQVTEICHRYRAGESSIVIGLRFEIPAPTICSLLRRCRITLRDPSSARRKLPLNETAFATITPESAYWSGFLIADGAVSGGTLIVRLAAKDMSHLQELRRFLGSGHKVQHIARNGWAGTPAVQLAIPSARLVADLAALGVLPRKSFTAMACPSLQHNRHFWRGVVDGDGHVGIDRRRDVPRLELVGPAGLLTQFRSFAQSLTMTNASVRPHKTIHRFQLSGRAAAAVLHHLYDTCTMALERKAQVARRIA
jgi:hypothetical protein